MLKGDIHRSLLPLALALTSCFASMRSGGYTLDQGQTEAAFAKVQASATFALECPRVGLELVVLDAVRESTGMWPGSSTATRIGVSGCGREAVYVAMPDGTWRMNYDSQKANVRAPE
jgi:hypothetical protein